MSKSGKAVKKPIPIDWFTWNEKLEDIHDWCKTFGDDATDHFSLDSLDPLRFSVKTIEGHSYNLPKGYIVIRGIKGEYYPCEPKIFEQSYSVL